MGKIHRSGVPSTRHVASHARCTDLTRENVRTPSRATRPGDVNDVNDRPSVWFHTFGCKANQYDTERIRQELELRGAETALRADQADVAVINTCTVTNQADANARRLVRRLRRQRPDLRIVVAGCSTSFREAEYRALEQVDGVVPGHDPSAVAELLPQLGDSAAADPVTAGRSDASFAPLQRNARGTRAWLKIQDGCDRKCSFCATRIARGASVSRPVAEVVAEAATLARAHPELVITGIHIGHYGKDLDTDPGRDGPRTPASLATLCERLLEEVPARFRLSSIEATEIDDRLVDLLAASDGHLAPHLHIPMQSGSDRVLRLMRRWHTREAYRARVLHIAERLAAVDSGAFGLGADIIVGFPGEGEEEFEETRALVEELPYTYLHVFPYSVRDGTVAASLPNRVPGDVAAARSRTLRDLGLRKGRGYSEGRVGSIADIVVEGRDDRVAGVTGDYLRVELLGRATPGDRFAAPLRGQAGRLTAEVPANAAAAAV
ncbi:MAG: MiaB/RimO family radical SAM methylthiotransferase [Gemmatimonadales bacterium]|nr:MiaB/RimO family radical SAM methylthiotransferase [Candidatus Palauibacter irciniicola]MYC17173.1 MiaB/RimO family radical SAM methylthiotransferase [Gemmatimonadales bacterium]